MEKQQLIEKLKAVLKAIDEVSCSTDQDLQAARAYDALDVIVKELEKA